MAEILVGLQGENRLSPSVVQVELLVTCRDLNHVSAWEPDQPIASLDSTLLSSVSSGPVALVIATQDRGPTITAP